MEIYSSGVYLAVCDDGIFTLEMEGLLSVPHSTISHLQKAAQKGVVTGIRQDSFIFVKKSVYRVVVL